MNNLKNRIRILSRKIFPKKRVLRIIKLRKEASMRDYYRVFFSGNQTCIIMVFNDPDGQEQLVQSIEEANRVFDALKVPVPKVYRYFPEDHMLIVKDMGAMSLDSFFTRFGYRKTIDIYKQIVEVLLRVHFSPQADEKLQKTSHIYQCKFTPEKFFQELDFFAKYSGLWAYLDDAKGNEYKEFFMHVAEKMCELPFVLTHRDLHSRNILIQDTGFSIIDHQDARMGPMYYDLVSMLKDSYVNMPHKMELELVSFYIEESRRQWGVIQDFESFFRGYYLCMFQRSIKAAGTFYYQAFEKNHKKYIKNIPIALQYGLEGLKKLSFNKSFLSDMEETLRKLSYQVMRFPG